MADDAPIALRLAARKTRTLAGEGIVLDLALEVRTELEMETVELNRGRTEVLGSALDGGQYGNRVLTGEDFMVLHRHPPLEPVGTRFVAPAGSAWTVQLELFSYARPPPAGAVGHPVRRARRKRLDGPTGAVQLRAATARRPVPHRGDLPLGRRRG